MGNTKKMKKITISPVTRIEGHAKITIYCDANGDVKDAKFHVNEFRGFEKFCEGRMYTEMPSITPRICGICPVSHAISSAKACEAIMRVNVPYAGHLLRRLIHAGQMISSHALSFFHLSAPDFLLGWDHDPADRNIIGIARKFPDLAVRGIRLRKFGQEISERITGKKIHIIGIVAGGMVDCLTEEHHKALLAWIPEVKETTLKGLEILKGYFEKNREEVDSFANFETLHMGLIGPEGAHELYDGVIRVVDGQGRVIADRLKAEDYLDFIAERPIRWSYLKYPYFKPAGYPQGFYRVGPLARLNVAEKMKTPGAQKEFECYRSLAGGKPVNGSFFYHYARLIETLGCIEEVDRILHDPKVLSKDIQAHAQRNQARGVGCSEAPRGILFHDYTTDENGVLTKANLLIATGQNNPAMDRSVLEVAKQYVKGKAIKEESLNRVEAAIRCYDPCLSCSTHALGQMPMRLEVVDHEGNLMKVVRRG